MEFTRRFGQTQAANPYTLPIAQVAEWQQLSDDTWETQMALPNLPADHLIVPSFGLVGADFRFQFQLHHCQGENTLRGLPANEKVDLFAPATANSTLLSDHIDCWHSTAEVQSPRLKLRVLSDKQPQQYLFTASLRPLRIQPTRYDIANAELARPPALSQMTAATEIRKRICSPTALAMALSYLRPGMAASAVEQFWQQLVEDCYDPVTRAYGMWPQAIFQANRYGVLASVESNTDWSKLETALQQNTPVVCSIRFAKGELEQAPLKQTAGHLVLVYGVTGTNVLVMDPAADNTSTVARIYQREQFQAAWLSQRGAAYFFSPASTANSVLDSL